MTIITKYLDIYEELYNFRFLDSQLDKETHRKFRNWEGHTGRETVVRVLEFLKHRHVATGVPPSRGLYDFKITLKPGANPTRKTQYRLSLAERRALRDDLDKKMGNQQSVSEEKKSKSTCDIQAYHMIKLNRLLV